MHVLHTQTNGAYYLSHRQKKERKGGREGRRKEEGKEKERMK
jgi:hypothetical protein